MLTEAWEFGVLCSRYSVRTLLVKDRRRREVFLTLSTLINPFAAEPPPFDSPVSSLLHINHS